MIVVPHWIVEELNEKIHLRSSCHSLHYYIINGSHSILVLVAVFPKWQTPHLVCLCIPMHKPATDYLFNIC